VPIKIVYLGHRYGSAVVVRKDGPVRNVPDLVGRTVAIPSRFSDEYLIVVRALQKHGIARDRVKFVEMPPPDVAGALAVGVVDAFSMGEPYPGQAELGGYGRLLFKAAEYWPDYMSCVVVVRQDAIDQRPDAVQALVDGIARSGLWLDEREKIVAHREHAADFVGRFYFNQPPQLLRYVLTNDLERVIYTRLTPRQPDFELVRDLMLEVGTLERPIEFSDYVDVRFAEGAGRQSPWVYEAGSGAAR
jgi:NitT/TauT family transport system substrate-binding protein